MMVGTFQESCAHVMVSSFAYGSFFWSRSWCFWIHNINTQSLNLQYESSWVVGRTTMSAGAFHFIHLWLCFFNGSVFCVLSLSWELDFILLFLMFNHCLSWNLYNHFSCSTTVYCFSKISLPYYLCCKMEACRRNQCLSILTYQTQKNTLAFSLVPPLLECVICEAAYGY